ncbi:MAG: GNAT family N-acetyltransferase [Acidobacteriota bacterium]
MPDVAGLSIEPFRGDFEGLERMAHVSWRDEYDISSFPNLYRPAFLRYLFGRLPSQDHLIAAYRGDEIVAFLANVPHTFHFRGKTCRATRSGLLVTRKEFLRRGIAEALVNEALQLNEHYKYDFTTATFETGHRSALMVKKFQAQGKRLEWMKRLNVIARILDLGRVERSEGLKTRERWAWVNHVAYFPLSGRERVSFVRAFLRHVRDLDCVGAIEWTKKYYPQGPFYRAHFFPYFRAVNMYSWTFNPELSLRKVRQCNEILV